MKTTHHSVWNKIFFNAQSIQGETSSSVLIKMPNNSQYKGWCFWHPQKLVREQGGKGYHLSFSFTSEWEFCIKLYGHGKYNKMDVIREITIDADEMKGIYNVVDNNVNDFVTTETNNIIKEETVITEVAHHAPDKIDTVESNIINELEK